MDTKQHDTEPLKRRKQRVIVVHRGTVLTLRLLLLQLADMLENAEVEVDGHLAKRETCAVEFFLICHLVTLAKHFLRQCDSRLF